MFKTNPMTVNIRQMIIGWKLSNISVQYKLYFMRKRKCKTRKYPNCLKAIKWHICTFVNGMTFKVCQAEGSHEGLRGEEIGALWSQWQTSIS